MVRFGQVVIGPPGSGKSTYCAAMQQILNARNRNCIVVNLDPQVTLAELPYAPAVDLCSLVDAEKVAARLNLGPNASRCAARPALLYCMEYLLENMDWLLGEIRKHEGGRAAFADAYLLYDLPGQVELFVHHTAMRDVIARLQKANQRVGGAHAQLVQVNLIDATLCADPFKYVAALLSSLSSQIFVELPHVNVLSKLGLLRELKGDLAYRLEYYTAAQDLRELVGALGRGAHLPNQRRFERFTAALCELIEDFSPVSFKTMDVEDPASLEAVVAAVDRAAGYVPLNEGDSRFAEDAQFFHEPSALEEEINGT